MSFARLRITDWVAMLAAVALLFAMASDWYSTAQGEEARRIERLSEDPLPGQGGEVEREVNKRAAERAEEAERNAWQADAAVDRLILLVLLGAAVLGLAAGFLRATGRRFEPPWTPSGLAAIVGTAGALLIGYRMLQEPGADEASTIEPGAPIAVFVLGALVLACAVALRHEEAGEPFRELPEPSEPPSATPEERPPEPAAR